jgi:hypothetical protein
VSEPAGRDYNSAADMLAMARQALNAWQHAMSGRSSERHAARNLAFAFGRLDALADLDGAAAGRVPPPLAEGGRLWALARHGDTSGEQWARRQELEAR